MARAKHLLIDESPIPVSPSLAAALGINEAIIFQQLHFLLGITETSKNKHNLVDGRWWVYNSYEEWKKDYFPWLHEGTIKRLFLALEKRGLVDSMQSVKNPSDRRKWYSINYEAWEQFEATIGTKCSDGSTEQNVPMVGTKCSDGYSETTSENTRNNDCATNDTRQQPSVAQVVQPHQQQAPKRTPRKEQPTEQTALFEVRQTVEPEREKAPAPPRKPDAMFDAIAKAWQSEAGMVGKIRQQLTGKMPKSHPHYASNFAEPATPDEVTAFAEWYATRYQGCDLPMAPEKIQHHFATFRRERAAAARKSAPRTRIAYGRLMRYDQDSQNWYDVGPAPETNQTREAYAL